MTIGVLALQGDFEKHLETLSRLGVVGRKVKVPCDLIGCTALIIPGGESTTIFRQIAFINLREPLLEFAKKHAIFGTCAGLILMSKNIVDSPTQPFGILDISIQRNAFGSQVDSFIAPIRVNIDPPTICDGFFIRAPKIVAVEPSVQVLATLDNEPVFVRQGRHLGACFHPELTSDPAIHNYFISMSGQ